MPRDRLGEDGAEAPVALINGAADQTAATLLAFCGEKFERGTTEKGANLGCRIAGDVAKLKQRITEEGAQLDKGITEEAS